MFTVQFMKLFTPRGCRVRRELVTCSGECARCHRVSLVRTKHSGSQVVTSHVPRSPGSGARIAHILNGARLIVRRARAINKLRGKQLPVKDVQWCKYSANHCENLFASSVKGMIRSWDPDHREDGKSGWEETPI